MGERPKTARLNGTAAVILKWIAGIAAAIIATLVVVLMVTAATALSSQGLRLAIVETRNEARDDALNRIETKLGDMDKKLNQIINPGMSHPR